MIRDILPSQLALLLHYDQASGKLYWLERDRSLFATDRSWKTWNRRYADQEAFTSCDNNGYRHGSVFDQSVSAHIVAWTIVHGSWPEGQIDHINGDRADNRMDNLREVLPIQNAWNMSRRHDNKSGQTGVIYNEAKRRWCANIRVAGMRFNLGSYMTKPEAVAARKAAEKVAGFHVNHGRG